MKKQKLDCLIWGGEGGWFFRVQSPSQRVNWLRNKWTIWPKEIKRLKGQSEATSVELYSHCRGHECLISYIQECKHYFTQWHRTRFFLVIRWSKFSWFFMKRFPTFLDEWHDFAGLLAGTIHSVFLSQFLFFCIMSNKIQAIDKKRFHPSL